MQRENRIYYNHLGKVVFSTGEAQGDVLPHVENEVVSYIDLPYGDTTLNDAIEFHVENGEIVIDKRIEKQLTEEQQRIVDLENQLSLLEKGLG